MCQVKWYPLQIRCCFHVEELEENAMIHPTWWKQKKKEGGSRVKTRLALGWPKSESSQPQQPTSIVSKNSCSHCTDITHCNCADSYQDELFYHQTRTAFAFPYPCTFDGRKSNQVLRHSSGKRQLWSAIHFTRSNSAYLPKYCRWSSSTGWYASNIDRNPDLGWLPFLLVIPHTVLIHR